MKLTDLPPDRLTPLYDGTPGIRGTLTVTVFDPPSVSLSDRGRDGFHSVRDHSGPSAHGRGGDGRPNFGHSVPDQSASHSAVGRDGFHSVPDQSGSLSAPGGEGKGEVARSSVPDQNPCLDFIASDESLDRYDEIVCVSGWDLSNYQRNPVFQNAHQTGDILHTLGKATLTEIRTIADRKALAQRIQFATDVNPMAKVAYGLYRGKFLNAVSVGFVPSDWEMGNERTPYRRKFLKQELLEVSAVAIPANPNALTLGYKAGAIEKSDLVDLSELIALTLSARSLSASAGEGKAEVARAESISPLLQLARDLQALFRKI
jgi:HK97 family phage prohead protease